MELVVPPIEDKNKVALITAKLAYFQRNSSEPIVFRIYDATTNTELTRGVVVQNNNEYVGAPVTLNFFGYLQLAGFTQTSLVAQGKSTSIACAVTDDNCGCGTADTVIGDTTRFTPDTSYVSTMYLQNSHLIKVQFFVSDYHADHRDRFFGFNIDGNQATKSSLNCIIFDASPSTKYIRQHGTVIFTKNTQYIDVKFTTPLQTNKYSIGFSTDKNVQIYWSNKTELGFRINPEFRFEGHVDWTLLNINN
jgi:hypothetical protein